eukprot:gb/GEZN01000003.1/.p1 GENE.gb/GEZN01000003.1/~~gb/GEZN01000003.1/.p1  ORF type:complete len:6228 (-),score=473.22 gb/GEZN01000003.1/:302-18958(-)
MRHIVYFIWLAALGAYGDLIDKANNCTTVQCAKCAGPCLSKAQCANNLTCFVRAALEPVPGCALVEGMGTSGNDYCYDPADETLIKVLDPCSNKNCTQCRGWCTSNAGCAGSLMCQTRARWEPVPGCVGGIGDFGKGYCRDALISTRLNGCGEGKCGNCEGNCVSDLSCQWPYKCMLRNATEAVPGCTGGIGVSGWGYCYDGLINQTCSTSNKCGNCEGQCSVATDCTSNQCYTRYRNSEVPGCPGIGVSGGKYCASYTSRAAIIIPTSYNSQGADCPTSPANQMCNECKGDCKATNAVCASGFCFRRDGIVNSATSVISGCQGSPQANIDYCASSAQVTAPMPENGALVLQSVNGCGRYGCTKCRGPCNGDGQCAAGLKCQLRPAGLDPVQGCEGSPGEAMRGYCYQPRAPDIRVGGSCAGRDPSIMCTQPCNEFSSTYPNCGVRRNYNFVADLRTLGLNTSNFTLPFKYPRELTPAPPWGWTGAMLVERATIIQCQAVTPYDGAVLMGGPNWDICPYLPLPNDTDSMQSVHANGTYIYDYNDLENYMKCDNYCGYCNADIPCWASDCAAFKAHGAGGPWTLKKGSAGCFIDGGQCAWMGSVAPAPCQTCRCDDSCRGDGVSVPYTCCDDYEPTCGGPKISLIEATNFDRPTAPTYHRITIYGTGFAEGVAHSARKGRVFFDPNGVLVDVSSSIVSWTDIRIILNQSAGFGDGRRYNVEEAPVPWLVTNPMKGVLRNVTANDLQLYAYKKPTISTITPQNGPTSGILNNARVTVTIVGNNFAVNKILMWGNDTILYDSWVDKFDSASVVFKAQPGTGQTKITLIAHTNPSSDYRYDVPFRYDAPQMDPITSVGANALLTITGNNFGQWASRVSVSLESKSCPLVSVNHTQVICTVPFGSGQLLPVTLIVDGQTAGVKTFSYPRPSITSISPTSGKTAKDVSTNRLTISGRNFGLRESASYVRFGSLPDSTDRQCNSDTVCNVISWNNTVIVIWTPEGPLSAPSHPIQVIAGTTSSNAQRSTEQPSFYYLQPTISSVGPQFGSPTGSVITVIGENFGTPGAGNVSMGELPDSIDQVGNCLTINQNHTQILCTTKSGVGTNIKVWVSLSYNELEWRNRSSTIVYYSYAAPSLRNATPPTDNPTSGLAADLRPFNLTLNGANFGNPTDAGVYNNPPASGVKVADKVCSVSVWTNTMIICALPSNTGVGRAVVVYTRNAQEVVARVSPENVTISYGKPVVTLISPAVGPTSGFDASVTGSNFGSNIGSVKVNGVNLSYVGSWGHTSFQLGIPPGRGENLTLSVEVDGQVSTSTLISYGRPNITGWQIKPATGGNTVGYTNLLVISGVNFGTDVGNVTIAGTPINNVVSISGGGTGWTHTSISVYHGPGSGLDQPITVTCGVTGFSFTTPAGQGFNFNPPSIDAVTPLFNRPGALDGSDWTRGGGNITIQGKNFGSAGKTTVTIDSKPCVVTAGDYNSTVASIYCTPPPGQGKNLNLSVITNGQSSAPLPFAYRAPILTGLTSNSGFPTLGNVPITIIGQSLGTSAGVVGLIDSQSQSGNTIVVNASFQNHTVLIFTLPPATGQREVQVTVAGQPNNPKNPETQASLSTLILKYDAPQISTILPINVSTGGGTNITLTGSNFGPSSLMASIAVTVGDFGACVVKEASQSQIICTTPPGQGNPLVTMAVNSAVSTLANSVNLVYAAPTISAIKILTTLPTTGATQIAINGTNFGLAGSSTRKIRVGDPSLNMFCLEVAGGTHTYIRCTMPSGVGAVDVVVSVSSKLSNTLKVTYDGPVIQPPSGLNTTALVAVSVPTSGKEILTIYGINFGAALADWRTTDRSVKMGSSACVVVSWIDTVITCSMPAGQGSSLKVFVTVGLLISPDSNNSISYDRPSLKPTVADALSPASAYTEGGIRLDIFGNNFGLNGTVSLAFGGSSAICALIDGQYSHISIGCTVPAWNFALPSNGQVQVVVSVEGQSLIGSPIFFTYLPPTKPDLAPVEGSTSGGSVTVPTDVITATGHSFGFLTGNVTVGGLLAVVSSWSHTQVKFWHPAGSGTSLDVFVITKEGRTNALAASFTYTKPIILSIDPSTALTGPSFTTMTVTGRSLGNLLTTNVTIGGQVCAITAFTPNATDVIKCNIPLGQGLNLPVAVIAGDTTRVHTSTFSYIKPTLIDIFPLRGPTAGGGTLMITGTSMGISGYVTIGGAVCNITFHSHTSVNCTIPPGQGVALAVRLVLNTQGVSSINSKSYDYDGPAINSTSPIILPTKGGSDLVVRGINFGLPGDSPVKITIGGVECPLKTPVSTYLTHTVVTCVVPEYALAVSATPNILVMAQVLNKFSSDLVYVQYNQPTITNVSSLSDETKGGTLITVTGYDFGANPSVLLRDDPCPITSGGLTPHFSIVCKVPAGQGVLLPVVVKNGLSSLQSFLFSYLPPVIDNVSPSTGPTAGSTSSSQRLTITGRSFGLGGKVLVGNVLSPQCTWGHSQVICALPAGQGQNLQVALDLTGRPLANWSGTFTYNRAAIDSLSKPQFNPTQGQGVLVILGNDFGLSGNVTLGGALCGLVAGAYSHTRIECYIPAGIGSKSVIVTVNNDRASLPQTYTYDPPVLTSINPLTGRTAGDFNLTLTGQNFGPPGLDVSQTIVQIALETGGTQNLVNCPVDPTKSSHTNLVCDMPEGAGTGVPVSVKIGGVAAAATLAFSFLDPVITKVEGCATDTTCCTFGCSIEVSKRITITGDNFGPVGTVSNTLGFVSQLPICQSVVCVNNKPCQDVVQLSHTQIQCTTPNRTFGLNVPVRVIVGGPNIKTEQPFLSYLAPTIDMASFRLVGSAPQAQLLLQNTMGGQQVSFNGSGFGDDVNLVTVEYALLDTSGAVTPGTSRQCVVNSVTSSTVVCTTQAGVGTNLSLRVTARNPTLGVDQTSSWTDPSLASIAYPPPYINASTLRVAGSPTRSSAVVGSESGGEALMFDAGNLGLKVDASLISIVYGPAGGPFTFTASAIEMEKDHEGYLRFLTQQGLGGPYVFQVTVLNQRTEGTDTYLYPTPPIVYGIFGCNTSAVNGNATENCPTVGGITLTVKGENFSPDRTTVKIGVLVCTYFKYVNPREATCRLPEGTGLNRMVTVTVGRLVSVPLPLLSYALAVLTSISGCPLPVSVAVASTTDCPRTDGATTITLTGNNFGPSAALVLLQGVPLTATHDTLTPHNKVLFQLPVGAGLDRTVLLLQGNGAVSTNSMSLSYKPCDASTHEVVGNVTCDACNSGRYADVAGLEECKACEIGYYAAAGSATGCTPCEQGRVGAVLGAQDCVKCLAGTFSGATAQTGCVQCAIGYATDRNGSTSCAPCIPGTFQDTPGNTGCTLCGIGRYSPVFGSISCEICSPGFFASSNSSSCRACFEGFHQSNTERAACDECQLGKSNPIEGQAECLFCTSGFYANDTSLSKCYECQPGYTSNPPSGQGASQCTPCNIGEYMNLPAQATCLLCPKGRAANQTNSASCQPCIQGYYATLIGRATCTKCLAGKYAPFNETVDCLDCAAGRVAKIDGLSACESCPVGQFAATSGLSLCTPCAQGKANNAVGQASCRPCTSGKYANATNTAECALCPPGKNSIQTDVVVGPITCTDCLAGYYAAAPGGQDQCLPCPIGTNQSAPGQSVCVACPVGRKSETPGQSTCAPCSAGYFSEGNAFTCAVCPKGTYSDPAASACIPCPGGFVGSSPASVQCTSCSPGFFIGVDSASACLPCNKGTFSEAFNATNCAECLPGYAEANERSTGCDPCLQGFFAPRAGLDVCLECPLGRANSGVGGPATICDECTAGYYANALGAFTCRACLPGYSTFKNGSAECSKCAEGQITNTSGQTHCSLCPKGRYSSATNDECKPCDPGYFAPATGQVSCLPCPSGTSLNVSAGEVCEACAIGFAQPVSGKTFCAACPEGSVATRTGFLVCKQCASGSFSNSTRGQGKSCVLCSPGFFASAQGASGCTVCPAGKAQSQDGQAACVVCSSGFYAPTTQLEVCEPCPLGFLSLPSTEGVVNCSACNVGLYSAEIGQASCADCPAGKYGNLTGQSACVACPVGRIQATRGKTACDQCDAGRYAPTNPIGNAQCLVCGQGTYSTLGSASCTACPVGTRQPSADQGACITCPDGKFVDVEGQATCVSCPSGTFANLSAAVRDHCEPCALGKFSQGVGNTACELCPQGYANSKTGQFACAPCTPGLYANQSGSQECLPCRVGYAITSFGATNCNQCLQGEFQDSEGALTCALCGTGRYSNDFARGTPCGLCEQGKYQPASGATACKLCASGTYITDEGQVECLQCSPGRFGNSTGATDCYPCPAGTTASGYGTTPMCWSCGTGTFQNTPGALQCRVCQPGTYGNKTGQQECQLCPAGRIQVGTGQASCEACPVAQYQPTEGQSFCLKCPKGRANNMTAQSSCALCPIGRSGPSTTNGLVQCILCVPGLYSKFEGQSECAACGVGRYIDIPGQTGCLPCASGFRGPSSGLSVCSQCEAGFYNPLTGQFACLAAPAGAFVATAGRSSFQPCNPGTFQPLTQKTSCMECLIGTCQPYQGQLACVSCPAGRKAVSTGLAECLPCDTGKYVSTIGRSSECDDCAKGKFQALTGQSFCSDCPVGRFSDTKALSLCTKCPAGYWNLDAGRTDCQQCQPGNYNSLPGQAQCKPCQPGKANAQYAQTFCPDCPTGLVTQFTGNVSCEECPDASYSITTTKCAPCERGRFGNGKGAAQCAACLRGYYQDEFGQVGCKTCGRGKYSDMAAEFCSLCQSGRASNETGVSVCPFCLPGKFQPEFGNYSCRSCPEGEYAKRLGQVRCDQCPPGTFSDVKETVNCTVCDYGEYQQDFGALQCHMCPMGAYADERGLDQCKLCPPGRFGNATHMQQCHQCPRGRYQKNTNQTSCLACPAGTFGPSGTGGICNPCPQGSFSSNNGSLECQSCQAGRYMSAIGASVCLLCKEGSYSNNSAYPIDCFLCESGTYANTTGAAECLPCPNGTYVSVPGASVCELCNPGFVAETTGSKFCSPCAAGLYLEARGQQKCMACGSGTFSPAGSRNCTNCEPGKAANSLHISCDNCPAGKYGDGPGFDACEDCYPGLFQDVLGQIECRDCALGRYTPKFGRVECTACEVGTFANSTGLTGCTDCLAGTHQNEVGAHNCTPCLPGQHASFAGQVECLSCRPGKYNNQSGQAECTQCPLGTFTKDFARQACDPCGVGKYSSNLESTKCILCAPGWYNDELGKATCTKCPEGEYQILSGMTNCTKCVPGYFSLGGLPTCVECQPGFFTNVFGSIECTACPQGFVNYNRGALKCTICAAGQQPMAQIASPACESCHQGWYSTGLTGASGEGSSCIPCAVGYHAAGSGASVCLICPKGKLSKGLEAGNLGAVACEQCPAGFAQPRAGQGECRACDVDSVQDPVGTTCLCKPGFFGYPIGVNRSKLERPQEDFCSPCIEGMLCDAYGVTYGSIATKKGYWSSGGQAQVGGPGQDNETDMGGEALTSNQSLTFYRCQYVSQCLGGIGSQCILNREGPLCAVCKEGFYAFYGGSCASCPKKGSSIGYMMFLASVFFGAYGLACWFLLYTVRNLNRLEAQEQILLKRKKIDIPDGVIAERIYQADMARIIAEAQQKKRARSKLGGHVRSPSRAMETSVLAVGPLDMSPAAAKPTKKQKQTIAKDESSETWVLTKAQLTFLDVQGRVQFEPQLTYKFKILIGFFQILSNMGVALELPWPQGYKKFVSFFSVLNFDLFQAANIECLYPKGTVYYEKYLFVRYVPIVVALIPTLFYGLPMSLYTRAPWSRGTRVNLSMAGGFEQALEAEKFMVRLARTRIWLKTVKLILFGLFLVYPTVSSTVLRLYNCKKVEGVWYLMADFNTQCYTDLWHKYAKGAWVYGLIYAAGIPFMFVFMLWYTRRRPGGLQRPRAMIALGILYYGYDGSKFWFEAVEMMHKLALVAALPFLPTNWQIQGGMIVMCLFTMTILISNPYKRWTDDTLHLLAEFYIFLFTYVALLLRMQHQDDATDAVFSFLMIFMTIFFVALGLWGFIQNLAVKLGKSWGMGQDRANRLMGITVNDLTGVERTRSKYEPTQFDMVKLGKKDHSTSSSRFASANLDQSIKSPSRLDIETSPAHPKRTASGNLEQVDEREHSTSSNSLTKQPLTPSEGHEGVSLRSIPVLDQDIENEPRRISMSEGPGGLPGQMASPRFTPKKPNLVRSETMESEVQDSPREPSISRG